MANALPPSPAHALLNVLRPPPGQPTPTDADADKAMGDFVAHLATLEGQHNRKVWSEQYLIDQVFGRARLFKKDAERSLYCRCHLKVALQQLSVLVGRLRNPLTGAVALASLNEWGETITDYIFDLADVVPFLQRRVQGYVYLNGGKNPTVHSWEVYNLSVGLAYQSTYSRQGFTLNHKAAQIASIAVLRQALELRFERLISVYLTNAKGKPPRLRHGFHQDFIVANPSFFRPQGFSIGDLKPVYDWCSEIVHQAYQPYAWQIGWALDLGGRLLASRPETPGGPWSIANGVEIIDVQAMQAAFEAYFLKNYDHGSWRMTRQRPEALVRNWTASMAATAPNFRSVNRRGGTLRRFWARIDRLWVEMRKLVRM